MYWPFKTSTHSQSEIFSLKAVIVACSLCSYTVAFQDQHTLPKRNILSHSCYCGLLSLCIQWPFRTSTPSQRNILSKLLNSLHFRTSTPSQSEIFSHSCYCGLLSLLVYSGLSGPAHPPKEKYSLKAVIVACSVYGVSFQDQHTLPKRNILSKLLLWLALCICISGPAHPPKVKYSLKFLLWLALSARIQWLFRTSTPSQREIFSLKLLLWLALSARIQWPFRTSTPSQREIFSQSCYCGLLIWSFLSGPAHPPKENIFSQSCYCGLLCVFAFQDQHTLPKRNILSKLLLWLALCICISGPAHPPKEKYSLKAVIVACSYGVSFQDQHTLPKRNILSKLLLWLALCICISGPAHPPKVKYSLKFLLWLVLSARIQWLFRTSTPSQREICSLTAVIVACSLCSYTVSHQLEGPSSQEKVCYSL